MKVLTLWPEWAWAICHLGKRIENRTWGPPEWIIVRTLAINAGANIGGSPGRAARERGITDLRRMAFLAGWRSTVRPDGVYFYKGRIGEEVFSPADIPMKAIVASCTVGFGVDAHPEQSGWKAKGQNHWLLNSVGFPNEPIPTKGAQGLWNYSPEASDG